MVNMLFIFVYTGFSSFLVAAVAVTASFVTTVLFVLLYRGVKHLQRKPSPATVNEGE